VQGVQGAARVFLLGMVSVKKVKNRSAALSSWSAIVAGNVNPGMPVARVVAWDAGTSLVLMPVLSGDDVGHAVAGDMAIAADKSEALVPCLGDQQAVEQIAGRGVRSGFRFTQDEKDTHCSAGLPGTTSDSSRL
jgi:hypothetical protein